MTNKEKYQRTFQVLHASDRRMEVKEMKHTKRIYMKQFVPIAAAFALALVSTGAAYATDVGGIQRKVQVWIHGDQTDATMDIKDGEYKLTYEDENGEKHEMGGGGVAYDFWGRERPLTEEELMEQFDSPDMEIKEDGSVFVYYHDQVLDITDKFEDGYCFVHLTENGKNIYMTAKQDGSFATSPHSYPDPADLE